MTCGSRKSASEELRSASRTSTRVSATSPQQCRPSRCARPACSAGEENLLGLPGDRYRGESILVHEFGHTILTMGLNRLNKAFTGRVRESWKIALEKGLWNRTYAGSNAEEYWAEGVQSWFDANRRVDAPDGIHNDIGRRADLKAYDPTLAALLAEVFADDDWRWVDPQPRSK